MGNTTIQDATTGNIMGLSPGFVPVGMKEHGGVLYIASYNPTTKEGELGTIPSPLFNYTYNPEPIDNNGLDIDLVTWLENSGGETVSISDYYNQSYIELFPREFTVCEEFMIGLVMSNNPILSRFNNFFYQQNARDEFDCTVVETPTKTEATFNVLTGFKTTTDNSNIVNYGMFKPSLYAGLPSAGSYYKLEDSIGKRQSYYVKNSNDLKYSNQWFLTEDHEGNNAVLYNSPKASVNKLYNTFPNIPAGKLYLKLEPETCSNYSFFYNTTGKQYSPFYYKSVKIINN